MSLVEYKSAVASHDTAYSAEHASNTQTKEYREFFPQVLEIAENKAMDVAQRADKLDSLGKDSQLEYPLNVHQYKIFVSSEESEIFWKMMQCKAVQPTLVVARIKTCAITKVHEGISHFERAPWIEGTPKPMQEEVFIDQRSKTIMFIAKETNFVATNRLIQDKDGCWATGTYFDGIKPRTHEEFNRSVHDLIGTMREYITKKEVEQLYQKYVVDFKERT
jgi:hypothetical protein